MIISETVLCMIPNLHIFGSKFLESNLSGRVADPVTALQVGGCLYCYP
jgi:hypothetical protein